MGQGRVQRQSEELRVVGCAMSSDELATTREETAFVNATQGSSKLGLQTRSSFVQDGLVVVRGQ